MTIGGRSFHSSCIAGRNRSYTIAVLTPYRSVQRRKQKKHHDESECKPVRPGLVEFGEKESKAIYRGAIVAPRKPVLAEAPDCYAISEELKKQIDDDVLAGRIYTIKEIQKLMRCSYDTARTRVVNEPGVIWFGDPRVPHCVFKSIIRRCMKRTDAA